jgi:hypothetical protein
MRPLTARFESVKRRIRLSDGPTPEDFRAKVFEDREVSGKDRSEALGADDEVRRLTLRMQRVNGNRPLVKRAGTVHDLGDRSRTQQLLRRPNYLIFLFFSSVFRHPRHLPEPIDSIRYGYCAGVVCRNDLAFPFNRHKQNPRLQLDDFVHGAPPVRKNDRRFVFSAAFAALIADTS